MFTHAGKEVISNSCLMENGNIAFTDSFKFGILSNGMRVLHSVGLHIQKCWGGFGCKRHSI